LLLRVERRVEKTESVGFDAVALAVSSRHRNSTAAHAKILAHRISLFIRLGVPEKLIYAGIVLQSDGLSALLTNERDQFRNPDAKCVVPQ
jgi:hypothetical protein